VAPPDDEDAVRFALTGEDGRICEAAMTRLWEETLGITPIDRDDDIFEMGLNSVIALRLLSRLELALTMSLPLTFIYDAPTIARMIRRLESLEPPASSHLVPVQQGSSGPPFFVIHGLGGDVSELFRLCRRIRSDGPVYAIRALGLDGSCQPLETIDAMANAYIQAIRTLQERGPYRLCGYSFGGLIAFEMARRLSRARLDRLVKMIGECELGIHDLSRVRAAAPAGLPRFNMPFECGVFYGALRFGRPSQRRKRFLLLDTEPYQYQKTMSDAARAFSRTTAAPRARSRRQSAHTPDRMGVHRNPFHELISFAARSCSTTHSASIAATLTTLGRVVTRFT
jgi:pimeloyl-ACP methyl ester carboxylesterase